MRMRLGGVGQYGVEIVMLGTAELGDMKKGYSWEGRG